MEPIQSQETTEQFKPAIDIHALTPAKEDAIPETHSLSEDELDDLAFDDPRVVANIKLISDARKEGRGGVAQELVNEQKALVAKIKDDILKSRGEYIDPGEQLAQIEEERLKKVAEIVSNLSGEESETELLVAFKIIGSDGQLTKESIQSPLFHTFTKTGFSHYLSLVDKFNVMSEAESQYKFGLKGIGNANADRTQAHDAVAKLVGEDLNLEFGVARRLVAKMRDEIYPGSGETSSYAMAIRRGEKLAEKYGGDVGGATNDELRYIKDALIDAETYHSKH